MIKSLLTKHLSAVLLTAVLGTVLAAGGAVYARYRSAIRERDEARVRIYTLALSRDSLEAAKDSTIVVLSDSLLLATRRVVQLEAADTAEKFSGVVEGTVETVTGSATFAPRDSVLQIDTVPFHFTLRLRQDSIDYSLRVDPIILTPRLRCGAMNEDRVRSAVLSVEGPPWLMLRLEDLVQDPDICNPINVVVPQSKPTPFWQHLVASAGGALIGTATDGLDGRLTLAGPALGAGLGLAWSLLTRR